MSTSYIIFLYHIVPHYFPSPTADVQNEQGKEKDSGLFPGRNFPRPVLYNIGITEVSIRWHEILEKCSFQGKPAWDNRKCRKVQEDSDLR